eukprot:GHVQ01033814.1.p1 GENE.GHVQ01033814.1~~GHVQ01033814.1.p1  ORF type:complete len:128 (-),score=27.25 GHVQ01033814.1:454-837(-)
MATCICQLFTNMYDTYICIYIYIYMTDVSAPCTEATTKTPLQHSEGYSARAEAIYRLQKEAITERRILKQNRDDGKRHSAATSCYILRQGVKVGCVRDETETERTETEQRGVGCTATTTQQVLHSND